MFQNNLPAESQRGALICNVIKRTVPSIQRENKGLNKIHRIKEIKRKPFRVGLSAGSTINEVHCMSPVHQWGTLYESIINEVHDNNPLSMRSTVRVHYQWGPLYESIINEVQSMSHNQWELLYDSTISEVHCMNTLLLGTLNEYTINEVHCISSPSMRFTL